MLCTLRFRPDQTLAPERTNSETSGLPKRKTWCGSDAALSYSRFGPRQRVRPTLFSQRVEALG